MNEEIVNACTTIDGAALEDFKEMLLKDYQTSIKENWYWMNILQWYVERGMEMVLISSPIPRMPLL